MKTSLPLLLAGMGVSHALTTTSQSQNKRNVEQRALQDRRAFVSAAVMAGASTLFTRPGFADVSDGNTLPPGAAQFSRLLKVKNDVAVSIYFEFESLGLEMACWQSQ